MAKRNNKKRHCQNRKKETHVRTLAESYYKQQASTINRLKPVMAAARRLNNRTAQSERDLQNAAVHNDNKKGFENEA